MPCPGEPRHRLLWLGKGEGEGNRDSVLPMRKETSETVSTLAQGQVAKQSIETRIVALTLCHISLRLSVSGYPSTSLNLFTAWLWNVQEASES